ncbi:MAG: D-2-hydroxyacid dehydrogenase [Thermomicrobiales bacterium]|nr:D-2-hydroxyacid dehydrogenase [Thermomicrobiales bacterium]
MSHQSLTILAGVALPDALLERLRAPFPQHTFRFESPETVMDHLPDADVLLAWGLPRDRAESAARLKWIQTVSAGVDRVDFEVLRERGIVLTNSSGIHAINIAEHILSLMFAFARRLPDHFDSQRQGLWNHPDRGTVNASPLPFELAGQTLFVVGMGHIGEALAQRAQGLDMNVVGVVRRPDKERLAHVDRVILQAELRTAISEADHVAICMPLTNTTRGMFDVPMLDSMKPGAFLYNIGRGAIVDQTALYERLLDGRLGGAGLDVTSPEPLPAGDPLWKLGNVIITPHTSGTSPKLWGRGVDLWIDNIQRFSNGEPLRNVVDLDAGY